jgi:hypothetical protein
VPPKGGYHAPSPSLVAIGHWNDGVRSLVLRAMSKLAELVRQAGPPISRAPKRLRDTPVVLSRERLLELEALLHLRDGFVTLGGAVVVRPSVTVAAVRGIEDWNQLTLWRKPYVRATALLFFAETVMGGQFALHKDEVVAFDPITGLWDHMGFGLDRWAERVLDDPSSLGADALSGWVAEHGPLLPSQRLQPRVLPQFQDLAELELGLDPELRVIEDLELMRRFARLHKETREHPGVLPEGFDEWWWAEGVMPDASSAPKRPA